MPVFVISLAAATLFCLSVTLLNGMTRLVLRLHLAPLDLAENGFLQYGLALALAVALWRKAARRSAL
jgi:hypothetical protein